MIFRERGGRSRKAMLRLALAASLLASAITASSAALPEKLPVVRGEKLRALLNPAGHPRLVHLWATWCAPCIAEWPRLAELLRDQKGRDLFVVAIAIDDSSQAGRAAQIVKEAGGFAGEAVVAPGAEAFAAVKALDPKWEGSLPTTYLVDAGGTVLHAQRGSTRLALLRSEIGKIAKDRATSASESTAERRRP